MTALETAERFLAARLATLSGLTAHAGAIPEGVALPAIRFSFTESQSASPQGETQLTRCRYRVVAVSAGFAFPHGIAESIHGALHGLAALVDGAAVHAEWVGPTSETFVLGGSAVRAAGGEFDVWVAWGR